MAMSGENIPLTAAILCSDDVLRLPAAEAAVAASLRRGGCDGETAAAGLGLMIRPRVSRPEEGLGDKKIRDKLKTL